MSNSGIMFIILFLIAAVLAGYYYQSQSSATVVPMSTPPESLIDLPPKTNALDAAIAAQKQAL